MQLQPDNMKKEKQKQSIKVPYFYSASSGATGGVSST